MPVGQMIALGVGSPSDITILTLVGLEANPVGGAGLETFSLSLGVAAVLAPDKVYALPGRDVTVSWDVSTTIVEGSINQIDWFALTSNSKTEALFIRAEDQVTAVVKKRYKL